MERHAVVSWYNCPANSTSTSTEPDVERGRPGVAGAGSGAGQAIKLQTTGRTPSRGSTV